MKCVSCGCSGFQEGSPCHSCGKGGTVRSPNHNEKNAQRTRGGGDPRHYAAFAKDK